MKEFKARKQRAEEMIARLAGKQLSPEMESVLFEARAIRADTYRDPYLGIPTPTDRIAAFLAANNVFRGF